jgi:hypothetical protein
MRRLLDQAANAAVKAKGSPSRPISKAKKYAKVGKEKVEIIGVNPTSWAGTADVH